MYLNLKTFFKIKFKCSIILTSVINVPSNGNCNISKVVYSILYVD